MNLKDEEWEPLPTDSDLLRKVRAATKSCVSTHDLANLRSALLAPPFNGAIPHEVRGAVWLLLLRLRVESLLAEDASAFAQSAREAVADHNSKEQIEKDVERTRPGLARFKQPAVRGALLRLLSLFCVRRNVAYVQGFNELLAPFVLLADTGGNPRVVFALFSEFVTRFAPWMLETSESRVFDILKRMFKYFGRLLLYHDPELYWLLERHMMTPDLYATSWFVTLFARNFTVESVLALWDLLLLEDNPLGTSFFGIALLCSKRDELLSVDESRIPETLMMLTANSPDEVRRLWKIGSKMRTVHTPPSFQRLMTDRLLQTPGKHSRVGLSAARAMQASVCLQTTPDDLVAGEAHYFTWDCRTREEYNAGHLAQAAFLPLDSLREANGKITSESSEAARAELQSAVDLCEPLKDSSHICLVGSGVQEEDNMDINMLALYLTRIGIRYVSTLRGGFQEALHAAINSEDNLSVVELVDFDRKKYERVRKVRVAAQTRRKQEGERKAVVAARDTRNAIPSSSPGDIVKTPGKQEDTLTFRASRTSSSEQADTPQGGMQSISSFLEKTDAEVSRALNKALSGMGLKYNLSTVSSRISGEPEGETSESTPSSISTAASFNPFSPNSAASPASVSSRGFTPEKTQTTSLRRTDGRGSGRNAGEQNIRRSISNLNSTGEKWTDASATNRFEKGALSLDNSPRLVDSPSSAMSPLPGIQMDPAQHATASPIKRKSGANGLFGSQRSPWGRDAKPGWLGDETLSFPLSAIPKGFTVNVMDDRVMAGLRLFPCRARSDRNVGGRGRSNEFKRRYVGVSANYFLLLCPHSNRKHLLEVKLIRYLQDIARITYKRSRPEMVTFEILSSNETLITPELVVCLMPDGLTECVALIKDYLAEFGVSNEAESAQRLDPNTGVDRKVTGPETENRRTDEKIESVDTPIVSHDEEARPTAVAETMSKSHPRLGEIENETTPVDQTRHLTRTEPKVSQELDPVEFGEFQSAPP